MHPLDNLAFPDCDFAVLQHGPVPHGRDYAVIGQTNMGPAPGTYQLQFTHVVAMEYLTAIEDSLWRGAWDDTFVDQDAWIAAGQPDGYFWSPHSSAWPGLRAIQPSPRADAWSARLGRPMYEAELDTNQFRLTLVFHEIRCAKLDDGTESVSQSVIVGR